MKTVKSNDRTSIGALDVEECLVLLRWEIIGRLAVGRPGQAPTVVPINFVLDGENVIFRTDGGEKYEHLLHQPVSVQVDRFDWYRRIGWSVVVQGAAQECELSELTEIDLESWAPGDMEHAIRIVPTSITGRRLELAPSAPDCRGYL